VIIIFGQRMYGKVDRVPGICYVITIFAHLNFIPLVPVRSYIVLEGTEEGGEFRGKEVSVSLKSVLAGYLRVWCGCAALLLSVLAFLGLGMMVDQLKISPVFAPVAWVTGVLAVLTLWVRGKPGAILLVVIHILSLILWYVFSNAEWAVPPARRHGNMQSGMMMLLAANLTLFVYGLTRLFDHAGPARTRELLGELGVELPPDDGEEPREERWEDWEASEDRRRR
jgi:hypothetical protein